MTRYQYKAARTKRGSLTYVARKLGIARSTLVRRESGRVKITLEAILAMRALPVAGFDAPMTAGQVGHRMTAGPRIDDPRERPVPTGTLGAVVGDEGDKQ